MSEPTFTIHAVPIADYSTLVRNPFPPVAADDDARAIGDLLTPYGGVVHHWSGGERDAAWVKEQLGEWSDRDGPRSSILLWVGHGESDGNDAWLASFGTAQHKKGTGHNASELADHLDDEWSARRGDPEAWTLVVIEACGAERFVELLAAAVLTKPNPPERFALLGVGGRGSSFLTAVPAALQAALRSFEGFDEVIQIDDLVGRVERRLAQGRAIRNLGRARPLPRPPKLTQGISAPLDILAELEEFIAELPADQRGFFIPKAQGTDPGELTWYFEGRQRERRAIADWLRTNSTGLLVVTGSAGSGKSAVLGNVVVHTSPELRELLIRAGRVDRLPAAEQPPDNVFDAAVLLTGLSTAEVVDRLAAEIGLAAQAADLQPAAAKVDQLLHAIANRAEPLTVLVDALDEAQEPLEVAKALIRRLAAVPECRVVVGSRRSTSEGPDLPEPTDSELLDALKGPGGITTIIVGHETAAVSRYVLRRLSDARPKWPAELRIGDAAVSAVAGSISSRDRHFLYARLAVHELIARPELLTAEQAPRLDELLSRDHRSLFSAAVERMAADPDFVPLLDALAHTRGRGLPRADGIWATVASALADGRHPGEADLDELRDAAAPYIMLDGENGQSTYRLAHQTFVEHFHAQPEYGEGHRRIARVLAERYRSDENGWADANFYAVRYLIEHLVADPDRIPPDSYGLARLVTDAGWLVRAVELLGIDQTVDVIRSARIITDQNAGTGQEAEAMVSWVSNFQVIDAVERTLRRSRIALARDPAQLPGLIHARLRDHANAAAAALGETIGAIVGGPWLRMVEGRLEWAAALESTYGSAGKVRGLGFGQVGDRPVVAIAIDTRVVLWDPRTSVPDVAASIEVGHRPTAVAVSAIDGRPVVVTSAGYDGLLDVWDARSGERLASAEIGLGHAIGVGRVNGRLVIAGVPFEGELKVVDAASLEPVDVAPGLADRQVRGFGIEDDGALLVLAVEDEPTAGRTHRIVLVDPSGNREIWRTDPIAASSGSLLDVMAGGRIGAQFVIAAGIGNRMFWFTEGSAHAEQSPYDPRTRAIAVGVVDGQGVVASAPDYDGTALVQLQEIEYDANQDGLMPSSHRQPEAVPVRSDRFVAIPIPGRLGNRPARDKSGGRPLRLDHPEDWPQSAAAVGELDSVPVLATGSVDGAVWIWDERSVSSGRPRIVAGPFVQLPPYVLDLGWELLHAKPGLDLVTSVALGNLPGRGPVVAAACGGKLRMYSITDAERIETSADEASAVECVALGSVNGRIVLVTGSTGGNLTVWDPAAGSRVTGLALDDPITNVQIETSAAGRDQIAVRAGSSDYTLELEEPDRAGSVQGLLIEQPPR